MLGSAEPVHWPHLSKAKMIRLKMAGLKIAMGEVSIDLLVRGWPAASDAYLSHQNRRAEIAATRGGQTSHSALPRYRFDHGEDSAFLDDTASEGAHH